MDTAEGENETEFLNVDLEVFSKSELSGLVQGLGRSFHLLHVGPWSRDRQAACFELWRSGYGQSADQIIQRMVRRIEGLAEPAKSLWNTAQTRQFNIGIQAAKKPRTFELGLRLRTIQAIGRVKATIVLTVYGSEPS